MANLKLSQITAAGSPPASTDQVVGVGGGNTDLLYSLSQIASTVLVTVGLTVGTTVIKSGTSGNFLYDNGGILGERTPTQVTAVLNQFTNSLQGLVPGSGGGTTNFLRADGTWTAPPGGGGSPGGSVGQAQWNNTTFAGSSGLTLSATLVTSMTMGLGSDATGDIYFNNGSGVLARLAIGSGSQVLGVSGGKPSWVSQLITSVSNSDGTLTISPTTGAVVASLNTAHANTWSAVQTFNNGDLSLAGSSSGNTLLEASAVASGTLTLPAATDQLVGRATTDTLTNKTLTSSTDVLGGVTMTLGSDATGDTYYRSSGNVLTRLGIGAAGQVLGNNGGLPAWTNYGRTPLSANTTYYVRTTPANVTISNASPAVVSWTSHGLSVNDPVVFCTPNNRTSGITVTIASPGLFTWTAHGLSVGFPVQFNSTGLLPTGLTAGTTYYVTNNGAFTANAFNVSDTQAHALAGTNTITTSGSQSGTHWGNWAGVAPTGVTFGTIYYVISAGFGANSFEFSTTQGGSAVNTSSASVGQMEAQTGNDANPGTAQTRTGAWLTSTHAEAFLSQNVDLAGFTLTIQYPAGYFDGINIRHQWFSSVGDYNGSLEASAYFVGVDQHGNTILQDNVAGNTGSVSINAFTDINQVQFFFNNVECRPTLDACIHAAYDENANLTAMAHIGTPSTGAGGTIFYNGSGVDKLINGAIIDDFGATNHVIVALGSAVKFWQLSGAVTGLQPTLQGNMTIWNQPNFSTAFIYVSNQAFGEYLIPTTGTTIGTLAASPTIYFVTEGSEFRHPGNSQTWTAFGLTVGQTPLPTSTQRNGRSYNYSDTPYSIQDIGTPVVKAGPITLANGLNSNVDWSSGDVGGMGVVYISGPTAAFSIGGWQKYLAGLNFKIYNTTSQTMTIVNADASSTTNYQIHTTTGANVAITGPGWAEFWYDNSVKRWILVNASQPSGSGGGGSPGGSSGQLQYDNSGSFGGVPSYTNASSLLALGNTTTAQQFLVYNTVDTISGPTNYERGTFDWTSNSNILTIGSQAGGTGSTRNVWLQTNATWGSSQAVYVGGTSTTSRGTLVLGTDGLDPVISNDPSNGLALHVKTPYVAALWNNNGGGLFQLWTSDPNKSLLLGGSVGFSTSSNTYWGIYSSNYGAPTGFCGHGGQVRGVDEAAQPVYFMGGDALIGASTNLTGGTAILRGGLSFKAGAAAPVQIATSFAGVTTSSATVTITIANPAVVSLASHGFVPGQPVVFATTGSLPTGINAGTTYYVIAAGLAAGSFEISATPGGSAVVTTGSQSGTQTVSNSTAVDNPAATVASFGDSGLTGSETTSLATFSQTWNTSGVTTALSLSITDIASGSGSKLLNLARNTINYFGVTKLGSVLSNQQGALATNATDGFLYIPTCAGQPTGTPTTQSGMVAIVWDTTNHKFWVYDTAWKGGTNPGVWT